MGLFSLIAALLLEHFRPLSNRSPIFVTFTRYAHYLERHLNAGQILHGVIAWGLAVMLPAILTGAMYAVLYQINLTLAWIFGAAILYLTIGLRYFSAPAESLAAALREGDPIQARKRLAQWSGRTTDEWDSTAVARVGIEHTLALSHKHLFGVLAWSVVLGPAGAVFYRLAQVVGQKWGNLDEYEFGRFGNFAAQVFEWVDWLPLRLTALSFAIVGDFEDAVYCWRTQAESWAQHGMGIVLASGAGALGVRLGEPLPIGGEVEFRAELGLGDDADADYLQSTVSLVWRAAVLWLALILLFTVATWVG
jgi:adenosylcobinamide-phosphate synthase